MRRSELKIGKDETNRDNSKLTDFGISTRRANRLAISTVEKDEIF